MKGLPPCHNFQENFDRQQLSSQNKLGRAQTGPNPRRILKGGKPECDLKKMSEKLQRDEIGDRKPGATD